MRHLSWITPVTAVTLLAACSPSSSMDDAMRADLNAAAAPTFEMAPRAQGTQVVSALESKNPSQPRVTPVRNTVAPARTPQPETPQPSPTAPAQQTARSTEPVAARPGTTPAVSPPPPGGYKTVGEVIRNAPFPIKP